MNSKNKATSIFKLSQIQKKWIRNVLRNETIGGAFLLVAAILALIIANNPNGNWFTELRETKLGPAEIGLNLTVGHWVSDCLLAIFFVTAGIELKHEFVAGSLKNRKRAIIPIAAALGGMAIPALIYLACNVGRQTVSGWAIPMATDIAFALAILSVAGRKLPIELRAFLLTLAVVDDLGAIIVIAFFYTNKFQLIPFIIALILLALFRYLQKNQVGIWYLYIPLAIGIWFFVFNSGIHATVAGLAIGMSMNLKDKKPGSRSLGEKTLHIFQPLSSLLIVPVFAFMSSGIKLNSLNFVDIIQSPLTLGIMAGLVIGKPIGVFLGAFLSSKLGSVDLGPKINWLDISTIGMLAGVGFTVSLLINELAFKTSKDFYQQGIFSVLLASFTSATIASVVLYLRGRLHARSKIV